MSKIGKVAFVTGASRGIGFATAQALAEQSVHVFFGVRNQIEVEPALNNLRKYNLKVDLLTCDTTKASDQQKVAQFFETNFGKLDILVNNAGIFLDAEDASHPARCKVSETPDEQLRKTFDVNFFSVVSLTNLLLPLIKKSKAGRIVNVSSILASLQMHADPKSPIYNSKFFSYDASKTAINAYTIHLAHELRDTAIKVNAAHPGWIKTAMGGDAALATVKDGARTSTRLALLPDDGPSGKFFHLEDELPW